ncbi:hypothetical protein BX616_002629 [Lobosporangium transversale]|uniref:Catalase n=1 Tax=Lobosporangium transversale TaxID=64571 RepID=A0A1Y2H0Z0_9FUNG|nr:catalase [Lobosporangium transversale]KAF9900310.1 hypothetical protein BX616_002629 [Lobosporangium transversale]ORZ28220.1 catalase [Lobosporangium transversale]|eukprot:XP_021885905.1 catalase [Lobosporangium transversale]
MASVSSNDVPHPVAIDEALGERLQPHEAELAVKVADLLEGNIHKAYDNKPGEALRDVHSRATGVLRAQFKVHEDIPPRFAKGVFVPGKSYEAIVRLSNGSGDAKKEDERGDSRGCAIKLLNVPGPKLLETDRDATTQDFLMINNPLFFVNDSKAYLEAMAKNSSDSIIPKLTLPFTLGLKGTLIAAKLGSTKISNPLQVQYFSAVPYQLGVGESRLAVKYSLKPVSTAHDAMPSDPEPEFLHKVVEATLAKKDVEFKFLVQPKVDERQDVEDSMTEWDEKEAPFYEIATLTVPRQDTESEELKALVERLSFNPWHSLAEHKPLGSINRTRKIVYERISRVRDQMNHVPREEPKVI